MKIPWLNVKIPWLLTKVSLRRRRRRTYGTIRLSRCAAGKNDVIVPMKQVGKVDNQGEIQDKPIVLALGT